MSPGNRGWAVLKVGAEVHSVVGLGSGAVHITGPDQALACETRVG